MDFLEWIRIQDKCHKSLYGQGISDKDKWKMGESWEACKNEALKIIDKNLLNGVAKIKQEIEKL